MPDIILLLLIVALDVTNSPEAQDDIIIAINSILASVESVGDIGTSLVRLAILLSSIIADVVLQESQIANRVLEYALGLQSVNQAYLLSLLNRSCSQSSRIARWVARGCLLQLSHLPPVS